ncbi:hypothetical protein KCU73_g42, partial [Aureobasidium melanogenum]
MSTPASSFGHRRRVLVLIPCLAYRMFKRSIQVTAPYSMPYMAGRSNKLLLSAQTCQNSLYHASAYSQAIRFWIRPSESHSAISVLYSLDSMSFVMIDLRNASIIFSSAKAYSSHNSFGSTAMILSEYNQETKSVMRSYGRYNVTVFFCASAKPPLSAAV